MDKKKLIGILIILIAAIILAALVYFLFFYNPSATIKKGEAIDENNAGMQAMLNNNQLQQQDSNKSTAIIETKQVNNTEIVKTELKMMSASFAERFGSFSNQSDYGNIRDLKIFMTDSMQKWADGFISASRAKNSNSDIYRGFTTKAIIQETIQFDEAIGMAEFLVKTQRKEAIGTTSNTTTFYQDIIIEFIKEKGAWKVNGADWQ